MENNTALEAALVELRGAVERWQSAERMAAAFPRSNWDQTRESNEWQLFCSAFERYRNLRTSIPIHSNPPADEPSF